MFFKTIAIEKILANALFLPVNPQKLQSVGENHQVALDQVQEVVLPATVL